MTVGAATTAAFHQYADADPDRQRLLHAGIPRSRYEAWNRDLAAADLPTWNPGQPYHFRFIADDAVGINVDCSSVAHRRMAGVRAHRSQWSYRTVPATADPALSNSLTRESWVVAWPPRLVSGPPSQAIFDEALLATS